MSVYNILGFFISEDIRVKITKLVLWIIALVLIVALGFSVVPISVKVKSGTKEIASKQVKNTQRFSDGLPAEDFFKYEKKISKAGKYRISFKPSISPDTCVLGCEVYDSDGKLLGASILYNNEDLNVDYSLTEGTFSIMFRYITTEQDFRDYVEEYDAKYKADSIRKAIGKVDFDSFKKNGRVTVSCKVSISSVKNSTVSYIDVAVLTGIAVALISVLIVQGVLYKQKKPLEQEVYDGIAPEVPAAPAPAPKPAPQRVPYGYQQPVYQYPAYQVPGYAVPQYQQYQQYPQYQVPAYQIPAYTMPQYQQYAQYPQYPQYQQYQYPQYQAQAPVTYQMPYQAMQPVQYAQPVYAPAPVQPAYVQTPVYASAYAPAQKPDYSAKSKKPDPEPADPEFVAGMKERIPAIGARYAAFCVVFILVQFAGSLILSLAFPDIVRQYKTSISLGLVALTVDAIGFPFIWLLLRGIPKTKIEQHKLSFTEWFGFLAITEALIIAGSLIGNPIHTILTQPFTGENATKASSLMENSNVILRSLVVGIGAPVFEELIFRKVLIDRTIKYGEYISIVMSGVMFGLLHGNFSQFFFATFVGILFAYVYIRTGRVRYTIYLHMAINLSSSLVLQTLLQIIQGQEKGERYTPVMIICTFIVLAWVGGVLALGIIGIIKFVKGLTRKRLKLKTMKGEPSHKEVRSLLLGDKALWLYLSLTILLFLDSYLPAMIVYLLNK